MEWCIKQVGMLALTYGDAITPERLKLYAADLISDLSKEQIANAIRRASRELKFFPHLAELRELSGAPKQEQREEVECRAAFALVVRHLEREGVMAGMKSLPDRVQFAVRQCGGLSHFNYRLQSHTDGDDVKDFSAFLERDFAEGYRAFPLHQQMQPQLTEKGLTALPPAVRLFLGNPEQPKNVKAEKPAEGKVPILKKMRPEPTEAELRDRKEMLKQQAQQILSQRNSVNTGAEGGESHPAGCRLSDPLPRSSSMETLRTQ